MTTKANGESVRQKLNAISKKLGVTYKDIETVFMIERLVARLVSDKKLASHLVFKGGFVGLKIYESTRYTIDLDALLIKSNIDQTLDAVRRQAESDLKDGVWFRFESQTDLATQGEYGGIRHSYRAGIGEVLKNLKKAQVIHFDFRSTELPKSFSVEIKKLNTARLERGWASAVDSIPNAISFKTAFDNVVKQISKLEAN